MILCHCKIYIYICIFIGHYSKKGMMMQKVILVDHEIKNDIKELKNDFKELKNETHDTHDVPPGYLKPKNAAHRYDCNPQMLEKLVREGEIGKYGRKRFVIYSIEELESAIGKNKK